MIRHAMIGFVVVALGAASPPVAFGQQTQEKPKGNPAAAHRCDWMAAGKMGISAHFYPRKPGEADQKAKQFEVQKVAEQTARAGAAWFLLTIHHQPWIMMAPNRRYDELLGTGDYTSQRDVAAELADALGRRNVRLMLYVNLRLDPRSACNAEIREAMGGWPPDDRMIANVASVYRVFSERYKEKVAGWWVDGAWLPDYKNSPKRSAWFATLAEALRAGNPDAAVAFNPGLRDFAQYAAHNDYTAGESKDLTRLPKARFVDGAQWHGWTYLGHAWGTDGTRFSNATLIDYAQKVLGRGGVLTFEVGTRGFRRESYRGPRIETPHDGHICPKQVEQLRAVREAIGGGR
jgi:alpha-L-fucosidase